MTDQELYHYGIKGMKWGVRRYQNKDGTRTPAGKKRDRQADWSDDARNAKAIKKKSVKQMSNKELRDLNERTRLEQEYSRLNPNAVKKGVKVVSATAATMGTVMTLVNNSDKLVQLGKKVLDRVGNWAVGDLVIKR